MCDDKRATPGDPKARGSAGTEAPIAMHPRSLLVAILALLAGLAIGRALVPAAPRGAPDVSVFRDSLEEEDWLERTWAQSVFLQGLSPENLPEALAALEPQLPWVATDELRLFMLAWSRFDAAGALDYALSQPAPYRRNLSGAAIYAWAFREPVAARAALQRVEDDDLHDFMQGRLVAGWVRAGDSRGVGEYLTSLPEGPRRLRYLSMLAWELSTRGPEAVEAWAEAAPAAFPRYKAAVFLKATSRMASIDPAGTARWVSAYLDRPYADGVLRAVARSWALQDPRAAMHWLVALPAGLKREASVSNAFRVWLDRDPEAAERWLLGEVPSAALDAGVSVMVGRHRGASREQALTWALRLDERALREQVVTNIAGEWLRGDPEPASAWFEAANLPSPLVTAIRARSQASDGHVEP